MHYIIFFRKIKIIKQQNKDRDMRDKERIAFLTQNEAPFRIMWVDELAKYIDVDVFHIGEYIGKVNRDFLIYKAKNARVQNIGIGRKVRLYNIFKIFRVKYNLFILDGYGYIAQVIIVFLLSLLRKKFIISIDGGFVSPKEKRIKRIFKSIVLNRATALFSTSNKTDEFLLHYIKDQSRIIRHYFSSVYSFQMLKEYPDKKEKKEELKIKDIFTVIAVGKFIPIKGFDILLHAVEVIDNIQVLIIGANEGEENTYNQYINKDNKEKVLFLPFCKQDKLYQYYEASDVLVMPSRGDVWGLVVGEAFANALPVISSDRCLAGLDMIEDGKTGYIFKTDDISDLSRYLMKLKSDPDLLRYMGSNCINTIEKYTIDKAALSDIKNIRRIIKNER